MKSECSKKEEIPEIVTGEVSSKEAKAIIKTSFAATELSEEQLDKIRDLLGITITEG